MISSTSFLGVRASSTAERIFATIPQAQREEAMVRLLSRDPEEVCTVLRRVSGSNLFVSLVRDRLAVLLGHTEPAATRS
jgi:hypothetical protein